MQGKQSGKSKCKKLRGDYARLPLGGTGRVDALARRGTDSFAVEVETGKSGVVGNVRKDLRAGFHKVLVVATDEAALKKVEPKLARAGLIIPGRVEIVLGAPRKRSSFPAFSDVFGADSEHLRMSSGRMPDESCVY